MGGFFSPRLRAPPQIVIPPAPPKAPQIDDAISRRNQEDQNAIKSYGRGSTLLTGTRGLRSRQRRRSRGRRTGRQVKKPTAPDPIAKALDARRKTHGDFAEQAHIAQEIKGLLRRTPNWDRLSYAQREALEHDATKTARILCGNPANPITGSTRPATRTSSIPS